jgi:hypothetical protein
VSSSAGKDIAQMPVDCDLLEAGDLKSKAGAVPADDYADCSIRRLRRLRGFPFLVTESIPVALVTESSRPLGHRKHSGRLVTESIPVAWSQKAFRWLGHRKHFAGRWSEKAFRGGWSQKAFRWALVSESMSLALKRMNLRNLRNLRIPQSA